MVLEKDFEDLSARINKCCSDNVTTDQKLKEKRILWTELQLLKYQLQEANTKITTEQIEDLELKLHIKPQREPVTILGLLRLFGILLGIIFWFPVMIALTPLRLLHPFLRKYCNIHNGNLPIDWVSRLFARCVLLLACIEVNVEGLSNLEPFMHGEPSIGCFQHSSNLDAFLVTGYSPLSFKWVGKKDLYFVPFLGQLFWAYGAMVGIDRKNRDKAIQSLKDAKSLMDKYGRSIAIAPEGTRSTTGQLQEFKKGPFHLAYECQVPLVPILIFGSFEKWPPKQVIPATGTVTLTFIPSIPFSEYQNLDYKHILTKVRKYMLEGISKNYKTTNITPNVRDTYRIKHYIAQFTVYSIFFYLLNAYMF
eukprot:TRINITY_DN610_c1_g1_i1.p1 TRINITY_DN610_c1_g1~~TRINITY_DN610_c1_g1_i1.p1  ORF type:complete len:364 (-),score=63.55 TRINITY_DN610_c1_g1_i1:218-1309(-)